jgi:cell shape-determining protein MreD
MGMHAFAMSLIFTVVTATARFLWLYTPFSIFFTILLAVFLKTGAFLIWGEFGQEHMPLQWLISDRLMRETVAAVVLTPVVFVLLYRGEEFGYRV